MRKSISAKEKRKLESRYGKMAASMIPYHDHLDFRLLDDFTDEVFAFLMQNVKGINMLDLNETDITNESISLLTGLEYVNELRVKECHNLNNACVDDLNKLTSLVFLHVRFTAITIDGLLKLNNLTNIKTLMFTADDVAAIKEKLLQLKVMLPQCDLVINSKPTRFNAVDLFIYALKQKPFTYRLKIKNELLGDTWSNWLGQPSDSYIEAETQGPYPVDDIEWIEINPIEKKPEGELIVVKEFDQSEEIIKLLEWLSFPYMKNDGIISVYILQNEV